MHRGYLFLSHNFRRRFKICDVRKKLKSQENETPFHKKMHEDRPISYQMQLQSLRNERTEMMLLSHLVMIFNSI